MFASLMGFDLNLEGSRLLCVIFGLQIPGQIATSCCSLTKSVMTRKTRQEGHKSRGLFWRRGGGERRRATLINEHGGGGGRARWQPVALLKDRWGDEFLTHFGMRTPNRPSRQGLTAFILSGRVRLDSLAEMQMIISCSIFFFFFWFNESQKVGWRNLFKHSGP